MVSLALVLPRAGRAGTLTVEPPRIPTECEAYPITWTGGTPPYTVTIVSPRAPPDNVFSDIDETHFIWTPDVPATFSVSFQVEDSTGSSVQTSAVTVRRGLDESCLAAGSPGSASQPSDSSTSSSSLPEPPSTSPSPSPSHSETSTTSTTALTPPTSQPQNPPSSSSDQASPPGDTHTPSPGSPGVSSGAASPSLVSTTSSPTSGFPTNPTVPPGSGSLGNSPATSGTTTISSPSLVISGSSTLIPPSDTSQPTALAPELRKHTMNIGMIVGIIVAAIALIVVLVAILVRRHRRRSAGAALRPDAFTTRKSLVLPVGASYTESSSWNSDLPTVTGRRDSKNSRFSVATDSSSIRAPTTVSSANAEPPTHIGSNDPSTMGELIELVATTASRSSSSSSPAKGTQDAPRNAIQEVLEALRAASPSISSSNNSDSKQSEVTTPQSSARAPRRERTRSPMERRQMWEEDGGVRLAGGPLEEPTQEILPPPYRRY